MIYLLTQEKPDSGFRQIIEEFYKQKDCWHLYLFPETMQNHPLQQVKFVQNVLVKHKQNVVVATYSYIIVNELNNLLLAKFLTIDNIEAYNVSVNGKIESILDKENFWINAEFLIP